MICILPISTGRFNFFYVALAHRAIRNELTSITSDAIMIFSLEPS